MTKRNGAEIGNEPSETERALCLKTLQGLRDLGVEEKSFFPQLLETFEHDAVEHLAALRSAIAADETVRLHREAHALRGASLTIGALGIAGFCQQLESHEGRCSMEGAGEELAQLERELARVKKEIQQENLIS